MRILTFLWMAAAWAVVIQAQVPVQQKEILSDPLWQQEYDMYLPESSIVQNIDSRLISPVRIDVYLGVWCDDSKQQVPHFLKILDQLKNRNLLELRYLSVERKKEKTQKYYLESAAVERIPTFIFFRDDLEIGRIIERPKQSLEEDILSCLF